MSVVSVQLLGDRRNSSERDGIKTHRAAWLVTTNSKTDGTAVALTATDGVTSIPAYGAAHPSADGTTLRSKDANPQDDSLYHFIVEGEYNNEAKEIGEFGVSPLDREPEIEYDAEQFTEEYFLDKTTPTAKPVVNSAGQPFETNPTRDSSRAVITITQNEESFDPVAAESFKDTINNASVTIDGTTYSTGLLKLDPIRARKVSEVYAGSTITYYRKTYRLKINADGWDQTFQDAGIHELISGKPAPILNQAGLPMPTPWPLNGSGVKKTNVTDTPATLTFKPYVRTNFSSLGLPT